MRCFIGSTLEQDIVLKIQDIQKQGKRSSGGEGMRWTLPRTLAFHMNSLGEIPASMVQPLYNEIIPLCKTARPINLTIEGLHGVPNSIQPKEVHLGIGGEVHLVEWLAEQFQKIVAGLSVNEKPHPPSIEIARLRQFTEKARTDAGRIIKSVKKPSAGEWIMRHVQIITQISDSNGPGLDVLKTIPLGQPGGMS